MIKSSNLTKLGQLDLFQVIKNILTFLQAVDLKTLHLEKVYNDLKSSFDAFDIAIIQDRKTGFTNSLSELDAERDSLYIGFTSYLRGCLKMPSVPKIEAAKSLLAIIEKYPYIPSLRQRDETAALTNLLQDIKAPEAVEQINLLGAMDFVNAIEEKNTAFENMYNQRTQKEAQTILEETKKARQAVEGAFRAVVSAINGLEDAMGGDAYREISDQINREVLRAQK